MRWKYSRGSISEIRSKGGHDRLPVWYTEEVEKVGTRSELTYGDNSADSAAVIRVQRSKSTNEETTGIGFLVTGMRWRCGKGGEDNIFALSCVYVPLFVRSMRHWGVVKIEKFMDNECDETLKVESGDSFFGRPPGSALSNIGEMVRTAFTDVTVVVN